MNCAPNDNDMISNLVLDTILITSIICSVKEMN